MSILDVLKVAPRAAEGADALYPLLFQHAGGLPAMMQSGMRMGGAMPNLAALASHNEALLPIGMGGVAAAGASAIPAVAMGINASDPYGMAWDPQHGARGRARWDQLEANQRDLAADVRNMNTWRPPAPAAAASAPRRDRRAIDPALWARAEAEVRALAGPNAVITDDIIANQAEVIRLGLRTGGEPRSWRGA